jgi:hypothetical protein
LDDIRPIWCEVDVSPRAHGSGLFTRGETQVLTLATLGTPREAQELDNLTPSESKRYMHHYNFPPFSTGEVKALRGASRREIGHGALAERALLPVIPPEIKISPYTYAWFPKFYPQTVQLRWHQFAVHTLASFGYRAFPLLPQWRVWLWDWSKKVTAMQS